MMYLGFILLTLYLFLLLYVWIGVVKLKPFVLEKKNPKNAFSIVIPFRNEAEHLPQLVHSLKQLNYPHELFEVLFVDDESEDDSVFELSNALKDCVFPFKIIRNKRVSASPKKDAITLAVAIAKNKWILTTDADCIVPKNWLHCFDAYIHKTNLHMVCGPVFYSSNGSFLQNFQQFDGLSLQAVTIGGFGHKHEILCNGANIAFKKETFNQVNGYNGNNHIASGDDIFLLEKFKLHIPNSVGFLKTKHALVTTQPEHTFNQIINQRVRWASKTTKQQNWIPKAIGLLVFAMNLYMALGWIYVFTDLKFLTFYLFVFLIKILVDGFLIFSVGTFFSKKTVSSSSLFQFLISSFLYPISTVVVCILSLLGTYQWKGRSFKT